MAAPTPISWQRSLSTRLFLLAAAVLAVMVLGAVALALFVGRGVAAESARRTAQRVAAVQSAYQDQALTQLDLIAQVFVRNPAISAYLAAAQDSGDQRSLLDLLDQERERLDFDFAIVMDPRGVAVAGLDAGDIAGIDLSSRPLVASALAEFGAYGVWLDEDRLYNVAIAPIRRGVDVLEGFLVVGFALDDRTASSLMAASDADVVLLAESAGGRRIAASTLTPSAGDALLALLAAGSPRAIADRGPLQIDIEGRRYVLALQPLGPRESPLGWSASLAALAPELRPYRALGRTLVWVGAAAVVLGALLLWWSSRRALGPLAALAGAARRAREGDYEQRTRLDRRDEIGELSRALDRLLSDLRERRDTETYLAQLARTLPSAAPTGTAPQHGATPAHPVHAHSASAATPSRSELEARPTTQVLGERFEVLETVGAGGMGVVYKALDRTLGEVVALKTVKPLAADPTWIDRLKDEIRLARKVTSPHVLRTFEFTEVDGTPFITMEFVHGVTLRSLLGRSGRIPYTAGLRLARALVRGIEAAHAVGVLHRDVKPENLLIEPNGNAKLMDFGISQPIQRAEPEPSTSGPILGTPDYVAPEVLRGSEPTEASDLYACGVVLYEIFTAANPFPQPTAQDRMHARLRERPVPPSRHWTGIPSPLEHIILRCLAEDPADRYPSAAELLAELETLQA